MNSSKDMGELVKHIFSFLAPFFLSPIVSEKNLVSVPFDFVNGFNILFLCSKSHDFCLTVELFLQVARKIQSSPRFILLYYMLYSHQLTWTYCRVNRLFHPQPSANLDISYLFYQPPSANLDISSILSTTVC